MKRKEITIKSRKDTRDGAIGLGFRVPLLIASPWSRGGNVCSEIFDHTSIYSFWKNSLATKRRRISKKKTFRNGEEPSAVI